MTRLRTAWAAAPLALLMACGAGADDGAARACTMIASSAGIAVVVEPPLAAGAVAVRARVCWVGECVDAESPLTPGQTAVDEGCDGDDPDSVCSAVMTSDGTMQGFVEAPALPAEEVEVTAVVTRANGSEAHRAATRVTAEPTYPNGKHCDPGGNQARVTLP
ncbi:hypothetical protein H4N58_00505 [Mumia sp. ZJ1417]|uniref:hypothetical protein n=1 Tax=unclassified Mumia TaxID=2621872 RepID=UPI0014236BCE|nr:MULTISPECIES: hypothetical protein [unclassified Mumia]QMW66511.1 hypothetical protein H4N58_00505 [Mumia sp. ZJ1417]